MTMHIDLWLETGGFIKSKVASGFHGNAPEVIRDAIRRMGVARQGRLPAPSMALPVAGTRKPRHRGCPGSRWQDRGARSWAGPAIRPSPVLQSLVH